MNRKQAQLRAKKIIKSLGKYKNGEIGQVAKDDIAMYKRLLKDSRIVEMFGINEK